MGSDVPFKSEPGTRFNKYRMAYHNSNRLLTVAGFKGVKTGITTTAGACLSVCYESKHVQLFTIVLGCRNIEYRWKDARRLTLWAEQMVKDRVSMHDNKEQAGASNLFNFRRV